MPSMKARAVRVRLTDTLVLLNGRSAVLVNISRSGALLETQDPVLVGNSARLTLSQRSMMIELNGKIVRELEPVEHPHVPGLWRQIAICFVDVPPPEVTALLRRLIAHGRGIDALTTGAR